LLPNHDFRATYQIRVNAPRSVVYECLLHADFSERWVTRLLMTIRSRKRMPRSRGPGDLRRRLAGTGFVILDEVPDDELVIGVAGRFWRPDGGRCMDLTATDFINFSQAGYAKVAWNFKLRNASPETGTTILSTDTCIRCYGSAALWKFRIYWSLVGPFSGLIRKEMLEQVKSDAESKLDDSA
jgi:hypothetical protein